MKIYILIGISVIASAARADESRDLDDTGAVARTAAGAFLPWTSAASVEGERAVAAGAVGWDAARGGALVSTAVEGALGDRVSLRAGATRFGPVDDWDPAVTLQIDLLHERASGIDLAVATGYERRGFNTVPAVVARVAVGRSFGRDGSLRAIANAQLGAGLEDGERYGEVRGAVLRRIARTLYAGVDARFAIDLERDGDEPPGEPDWQLAAGPAASYVIDKFTLSATVGVSAIAYRLVPGKDVGALGMLGLGRAF